MIILKKHTDNLFFKYIKEKPMFPLYKDGVSDSNLFIRLARKFDFPIPSFLFGEWKKKVKSLNEIIFFDDGFQRKTAEYVKKHNPKCRIILWFWNPVDEYNKSFFATQSVDEFWTYSKNDAKKYGMSFNTQFYTKNVKIDCPDVEEKVVFLGRDKGRRQEIETIGREISKDGIKTDFTIIEDESGYISYEEYLRRVQSSQCILDYNVSDTDGLTLRVMEAIFFEKKLITNNSEIVHYDFYNPDNIFIIGKDSMKRLKKFIESPYKEINKNIVEYYEFENWLKRFKKEEK